MPVCVILQKNIYIKNLRKDVYCILVPGTFVIRKIKHSLYWKIKLLKKTDYIGYTASIEK